MDKKALERALKELDEFLERHPHLKGLQGEIDRMLEQCGPDPVIRLKFLFKIMGGCLEEELLPNVEKLHRILQDAKKEEEDKAS